MIDDRLLADVNLLALEERRHRDHDCEFFQVPLEVVRHRHHRAVAVADQHHLRGLVEQLRVGLRDVEAAEAEDRRRRPRGDREKRDTEPHSFHDLLLYAARSAGVSTVLDGAHTYREPGTSRSTSGTAIEQAASDQSSPFVRNRRNCTYHAPIATSAANSTRPARE